MCVYVSVHTFACCIHVRMETRLLIEYTFLKTTHVFIFFYYYFIIFIYSNRSKICVF